MIKKTALVFVMVLTVVAGCGEPAVDMCPILYPPNEAEVKVVNTEEEDAENIPEHSTAYSFSEDEIKKEDLIYDHYSSDESVYIHMNYTTDESCIVDGEEEIPVDLETGIYGPYIEKFDADGDGQDEYIISECENTGTCTSTYGLCIVDNKGDEYVLTRYNGQYFTEIIEDRISCEYDSDSKEMTVTATNSGGTVSCSKVMDYEAGFEKFYWGDIIRIRLIDKKIYLSAPTGFVIEDDPEPQYDQSVEVLAPITVKADSSIIVGDFSLGEDNGIKTP